MEVDVVEAGLFDLAQNKARDRNGNPVEIAKVPLCNKIAVFLRRAMIEHNISKEVVCAEKSLLHIDAEELDAQLHAERCLAEEKLERLVQYLGFEDIPHFVDEMFKASPVELCEQPIDEAVVEEFVSKL
ncbi:MAG: hypothetical protein WD873_04745 [Candidatus Hydrogenedentales bacterium]